MTETYFVPGNEEIGNPYAKLNEHDDEGAPYISGYLTRKMK